MCINSTEKSMLPEILGPNEVTTDFSAAENTSGRNFNLTCLVNVNHEYHLLNTSWEVPPETIK